jgi:hypothetical protein
MKCRCPFVICITKLSAGNLICLYKMQSSAKRGISEDRFSFFNNVIDINSNEERKRSEDSVLKDTGCNRFPRRLNTFKSHTLTAVRQ